MNILRAEAIQTLIDIAQKKYDTSLENCEEASITLEYATELITLLRGYIEELEYYEVEEE